MLSSISSKKRTKISLIVAKLNSFVCFLEERLAWKNHFDFVWPLEIFQCAIWQSLQVTLYFCLLILLFHQKQSEWKSRIRLRTILVHCCLILIIKAIEFNYILSPDQKGKLISRIIPWNFIIRITLLINIVYNLL